MKTMRVAGVVVVAGIGIGAALSYLFPNMDFGLGSGGLGWPNSQPQTQVVGIEATPAEEAEADTKAKLEAKPEPAPTVVYVLIDGREYLLRNGPEGKAAYQPATLNEVLAAAQSATGDDNGIRVRIEQKSSSRELSERSLRESLESAGIPKDAIRWKDEPVD